jgi:hypothetical protein
MERARRRSPPPFLPDTFPSPPPPLRSTHPPTVLTRARPPPGSPEGFTGTPPPPSLLLPLPVSLLYTHSLARAETGNPRRDKTCAEYNPRREMTVVKPSCRAVRCAVD